jgi:peptidyl-prolyl cis-trans isomerase D
MLSSLRSAGHSFVMKLLMLLLVLSFGVWGVGDMLRSTHNGQMAKVGSEVINYSDFARNVNLLETQLQAMGMSGVDRGAMEEEVLRRMIEEKMVQQRLREIGLDVNERLLAQRLSEAPMFKGITGKFDPKMFQATLAQRRMSEAAFLNDLKSDIRNAAFTTSLGVDDLSPPDALAALMEASSRETRSIILVRIPANASLVTTPDAAALQAYYDRSKELYYMEPERRTVEYVSFTQRDLDAFIAKQVSDDAIKERFESDPERFGGAANFEKARPELEKELRSEAGEQVVDQLSTTIEDSLAAGDSMGDAIAKAGIQATPRMLSNITGVQYANKGDLEAQVAASAYAMEEGETSNLQTTKDGSYYLLTVKSVTPASPKPFEQVKGDVEKRLADTLRGKAARLKGQAVKDALASGDNWKEALAKESVAGHEISGVKRAEAGETSAVPKLLAEAVFEHPVGEVAGPLVQENGEVLVAKVIASTPGNVPSGAAPHADKATLEAMRNELLQDYYQSLSKRYPVTLNQGLIAQIRAQRGDS